MRPVLLAILCALPLQAQTPVAERLLAALDLTRPDLAQVAALAKAGQPAAALERWRDQVLERLRARDMGVYGWLSLVLHPRPNGTSSCSADASRASSSWPSRPTSTSSTSTAWPAHRRPRRRRTGSSTGARRGSGVIRLSTPSTPAGTKP